MSIPGPGSIYEFSDFRLDCGRFELLRKSYPLRVERKPMELLILLAASEGQLVTRAEIAQHLWSGEVFVDTEHGINTAIRKLRQILRDDPDNPKFIQTVVGMGYRFIAPMVEIEAPAINRSEPVSALADLPALASSTLGPPIEAPAPGRTSGFRMPRRTGLLTLAAVLVLLSLFGVRFFANRATQGHIRSIVILPLENLSGDAAQEYLAEGMTGELINSLGQTGGLRVISLGTAMQYKHSRKPESQIAQELNVDAVIDGSVILSGDVARISIRLREARADGQIWAHSFVGYVHDIFGLQNRVAVAVAEQIRIKPARREQTRLAATRSMNPQAYEAFLKGQFYFEANASEASQTSLRYFQRSVALDPSFARAWVGLGRAYNLAGEWGLPAGEAAAAADAAVAKAVLLEPDLAEVYAERGWTSLYYHWDFPGAEQGFRQALALDPNSSDAHEGLADYYMVLGRFDESFAESKQARELNPYSPIVLSSYCMALNFARRYDQAAGICSAALELDPNYHFALYILQQVYYQQRNFKLANQLQQRLGSQDADRLAMLREIHGEPGVKGAFDHWLKEQKTPPDPYFLAVAYSGLGRKDRAFDWLQKSFEQRNGPHKLTWVPVDPMFDALRSDPRFDALLQRVGLPPQPRGLLNVSQQPVPFSHAQPSGAY